MPDPMIRVLTPAGALGSGVSAEELERGVSLKPHAIALDAGSTDSGPAYLATGRSKYSREAVARDLRLLLRAREAAGVPLLIGSCGTSGCDAGVDWTAEIVAEILQAEGRSARVARLYSEQAPATVVALAQAGRTRPLAPAAPLTEAEVLGCRRIVALMGVEPFIDALNRGADIVLAGRATDTAVLAAVPVMCGAGWGPAWHAAKIAECGGVCTVDPGRPGVMISVAHDSFEVEPLSPANRCTPQSVAAHMLYENADPFRLVEPGGLLDVSQAVYDAVDDRTVRSAGARWTPQAYTMKLEGAGGGPFQTLMLVGIEDPSVLADPDGFMARMQDALERRVQRTLGADAGAFHLSLRAYGWNAVSGGAPPPETARPRELGLMLVVTAATQALATQIAKVCNPYFFHFPAKGGQPMPSYAFPFSPAEVERGEVFEFRLNHVVETDDPLALVRLSWSAT